MMTATTDMRARLAEDIANYVETHRNYGRLTKREAVVEAVRVLTEDIGAAQAFVRAIGLDIDIGLYTAPLNGSPETHGPAVGGSESRVAPGQPADGERSAPPTDCDAYTAIKWPPGDEWASDDRCVNCGQPAAAHSGRTEGDDAR